MANEKLPLKVGGVQFGHMVERDSYDTALIPVKSPVTTTLDGAEHFEVLGYRHRWSGKLNPQTVAALASFIQACRPGIVEVTYYHLQLAQEVTEPMALAENSATFLSHCLAKGTKWAQLEAVTLEGTKVHKP